MIAVRRSEERGHFNHGWLDTFHTFSFAEYQDPRFMAFRALRVINEDRVAAGKGFATHSHRDMEILTYVLEGALSHKDSLGNGSEIRPGEIQRMSAGTGISHSEFNPSNNEAVHLLQIWILPRAKGSPPGYEQKKIDLDGADWTLIGSPDGKTGVRIEQDVRVWAAKPKAGSEIAVPLPAGRHGWLQVARGALTLGEFSLGAGDGAGLSPQPAPELGVEKDSELLFFDLA